MSTFLPSLCVTQILLYMTGALPCYTTTGSVPRGSDVDADWGGLSVCGTISCEHLREVKPMLCFCRDPEGMQEVLAEKDLSREELRSEWTLPAPELLVRTCAGALSTLRTAKDWSTLLSH